MCKNIIPMLTQKRRFHVQNDAAYHADIILIFELAADRMIALIRRD
jgi:hypothetical protein